MLNTSAELRQDPAPTLQSMLTRYAIRYYISGRERDLLVERSARALASDPELILDGPIEKAVAMTMHRLFMQGEERQHSHTAVHLPRQGGGSCD